MKSHKNVEADFTTKNESEPTSRALLAGPTHSPCERKGVKSHQSGMNLIQRENEVQTESKLWETSNEATGWPGRVPTRKRLLVALLAYRC